MGKKLPELAIDNYFSSEAFNPDEDGVYTTMEYRRKDNTLYMVSTLSNKLGAAQYQYVTWDFYDVAGTKVLHSKKWELAYDINMNLVQKKVN